MVTSVIENDLAAAGPAQRPARPAASSATSARTTSGRATRAAAARRGRRHSSLRASRDLPAVDSGSPRDSTTAPCRRGAVGPETQRRGCRRPHAGTLMEELQKMPEAGLSPTVSLRGAPHGGAPPRPAPRALDPEPCQLGVGEGAEVAGGDVPPRVAADGVQAVPRQHVDGAAREIVLERRVAGRRSQAGAYGSDVTPPRQRMGTYSRRTSAAGSRPTPMPLTAATRRMPGDWPRRSPSRPGRSS